LVIGVALVIEGIKRTLVIAYPLEPSMAPWKPPSRYLASPAEVERRLVIREHPARPQCIDNPGGFWANRGR